MSLTEKCMSAIKMLTKTTTEGKTVMEDDDRFPVLSVVLERCANALCNCLSVASIIWDSSPNKGGRSAGREGGENKLKF